MGWAVGYDSNWGRDIGYGVPAICDHPGCNKEINRGLKYVCGHEPYGGDHGCGLYFCDKHLYMGDNEDECEHRIEGKEPFKPKPDTEEWMRHKLTDHSWQQWRDEHPAEVDKLIKALEEKC